MGNDSIRAIKDIKRKLDLNEMSVLVGAGFSKNVDQKAFLSWWELLKPMVLFLFEDEIELAYNSISDSVKKKSWTDFVDDRVQHYIKKIGYTRIATLYAERKGNLESITTFIEAHTPWIKNANNKKELVIGQEGSLIKVLPDDALYQHELLVNLNWNNVYTTNYDNALECVLDVKGKEELTERCSQLKKNICDIEFEINSIKEKELKARSELDELEKLKKYIKDNGNVNIANNKISDNNIEQEREKEKELDDNIHKKQTEIWNIIIALNSKRNELDKLHENFLLLENALHEVINVVSNSSELSIKRNKNIIKLHGSLRFFNKDRQYGFDGDNRNQYVFSEESYKQYPQKHEAFTNLMRISLLQESFLLIGFSGVDPNFTEWIKWVRDIIEVKQEQNIKNGSKLNNYKVYLLDLENYPLDEDLNLYYENHNIFRVQLMNEDVITYLENNSSEEVRKDKTYKYVINLLLKYFSTDIQSLSIKLALTQFEANSISTLINKITYSNLTFEDNTKLFIDLAKNYSGKEDATKYTKLNTSETINSIQILQKLLDKHIITTSNSLSKEDKGYLLESICIIIEILNLPIYNIFNKTQQQAIKKAIEKTNNQELIDFYFSLNEKFSVFQSTSERIYKSNIYKTYNLMYKFNMYDLLKHVSRWKPENEEELFTKLSIQYLFDQIKLSAYLSFEDIFKQGSLNTYLKYIKLAKIILNRELFYSGAINITKKDKLNRLKSLAEIKIKYLEQNGIESGEKRIEEYLSQLKTKEKIEKYGKDRFSTSKTIYIGGTPEDKMVLATVQGLYSLHKYTNTHHIYDVDPVKWYELTKVLLTTYPDPIIFYSLCKGDKELLQRLGKDLAFVKEKEEILKSLMLIFWYDDNKLPNNRNYQFKANLLVLLSQMLHHIETKIWNSFFSRFWSLHKEIILKTSFRNSEYADFTYIGLLYSSSTEQFILDILKKIEDINYKDEYQVLPKLMAKIEDNANFKQNVQIDNSYKNLLVKKDVNPKYIWIISSYLFDILNITSKKELKKLILKEDFEKGMSDHYFSDIIYKLSKKDDHLRRQFEQTVFTPNRLWDTGYSENNGKYISYGRNKTLFYLEYFNLQLKKLIVQQSPIINRLYNSLQDTYTLIKKVSEHRFSFDDTFDTQLRNIFFFLNKLKENTYETQNISTSDIDKQLENFREIAFIPISQQEIREMLSSKEKEDFNKAMEALNYEMFRLKHNITNFQFEINLIFGRLFSVDDTFESGLGYITSWALNRRKEFIPLFDESLLLLLKKYFDFEVYPNELDKLYIIQHLTIISVVLQNEVKYKTEIVDLFIKKSKKLKFNIVKKAILDAKEIMERHS